MCVEGSTWLQGAYARLVLFCLDLDAAYVGGSLCEHSLSGTLMTCSFLCNSAATELYQDKTRAMLPSNSSWNQNIPNNLLTALQAFQAPQTFVPADKAWPTSPIQCLITLSFSHQHLPSPRTWLRLASRLLTKQLSAPIPPPMPSHTNSYSAPKSQCQGTSFG